MSDNISAATSVVNTVIGMKERNFPITHGKNIKGRNTTRVVIVHEINGALKSWTANKIADLLEYHNLIFSLAHSMITITVSIAIQSVRTNEKLVRKFMDIPSVFKTMNVIKNANGINRDAIIDSLTQTKINIVRNTRIIVLIAVAQRLL